MHALHLENNRTAIESEMQGGYLHNGLVLLSNVFRPGREVISVVPFWGTQ